MPTLPYKVKHLFLNNIIFIQAKPLPNKDSNLIEYVGEAFGMIANTAPSDATGHPAMSVPCGMVKL